MSKKDPVREVYELALSSFGDVSRGLVDNCHHLLSEQKEWAYKLLKDPNAIKDSEQHQALTRLVSIYELIEPYLEQAQEPIRVLTKK